MALNEINQKDLHSTIKITISKMELIGTCLQEKESLKSEERKKNRAHFLQLVHHLACYPEKAT